MATVEADVEYDEITFEQDIFYAAVKVEPDVNQPNSPSFAYVCVKDEPQDFDNVQTCPREEGAYQSHNPDNTAEADPLLLEDVKMEIKEELDHGVSYHCPKTIGVCPMPESSLEVKNEEIQEPTISPRAAGKLPPNRVLRGTARSFPCSVCDKQFKSDAILKQHLVVHSNEKSLSRKVTPDRVLRGTARSFPCSVCDEQFKSNAILKQHLVMHSNETAFSLMECEKACSREVSLQDHFAKTKSDEKKRNSILYQLLNSTLQRDLGNKPFSCHKCKKKFKLKRYLRVHMVAHTTERPFSCDQCDNKFKTAIALKLHMMRNLVCKPLSSDTNPYSCHKCEKKFKQKSRLQYHMLAHTIEESYACDLCDSKFKAKDVLERHMIHHFSCKLSSCNLCEKTFGCKNALKSHMICHSLARPFSCSLCPATCKTQGSFNRHLKVHSEETPYSCTKCEKKFKRNQCLERHMLVHTGERPFACTQCKSTYKHRAHLRIHMSTHSTEAPYTCAL